MINGHKLIIQDKAEGHYPQLVINPHEMTGIEIVITTIMKIGGKKQHDIVLMTLSISHHPIKLLELFLTLYTVYCPTTIFMSSPHLRFGFPSYILGISEGHSKGQQ